MIELASPIGIRGRAEHCICRASTGLRGLVRGGCCIGTGKEACAELAFHRRYHFRVSLLIRLCEDILTISHFSMRYRPELELCLREVSLEIKGGERVGVVGRTGAGKSSLTLALFRILEAAGGKIIIDGVDISEIGLHDLRSIISIIPQDPQLFEGTLRTNIDPTNSASDADLWQSLSQAYLKDHVMTNMGGSLDAEIAEGGQSESSDVIL